MWADVVRNRAGDAPTMQDMVGAMAQFAATSPFNRTSLIFVAVGNDIRSRDNATLSRPTSWDAKFVRVPSHLKSLTAKNKKWGAHHTDHTLSALVDLTLCHEASWFVGWPGSTFARTLAFYHLRLHGEWYATCPHARPLLRRTDNTSWLSHTMCLDTRLKNSSNVTRQAMPLPPPPPPSQQLAGPQAPGSDSLLREDELSELLRLRKENELLRLRLEKHSELLRLREDNAILRLRFQYSERENERTRERDAWITSTEKRGAL
jgi:hypothetical protein